jgi:hypothetical protein
VGIGVGEESMIMRFGTKVVVGLGEFSVAGLTQAERRTATTNTQAPGKVRNGDMGKIPPNTNVG